MPAAKTRAIGWLDVLPSFSACSNSPFSTSDNICCKTSFDFSLVQNMIRSMVSASEIKEHATSGIITIPPLMMMATT